MKIKRKFRGIAILDAAIATVMLMLITGSFATLFGSQFQQLKAGKSALEAQQIAELNASILKTLDYTKITDETELASGKLHSTRGGVQTSSITGYEDEIIFSDEFSLSNGTKYRIATINVYKTGDTMPRSTLTVPFSDVTSEYANVRNASYPQNKIALNYNATKNVIEGNVDGVSTKLGDVLPVGTIIAYYGDLGSIPDGWALCNGANGTPNLLDRFLVGAGSGYGLGASGGENTHVLTINEMPSHNHSYVDTVPELPGDGDYAVRGDDSTVGFGRDNTHRHHYINASDFTGGSFPHENRPPYVAVYYIMKIR